MPVCRAHTLQILGGCVQLLTIVFMNIPVWKVESFLAGTMNLSWREFKASMNLDGKKESIFPAL